MSLEDGELNLVKPGETLPVITLRGGDWLEFSRKVFDHVEEYTVPQYGDRGEDAISKWTAKDCIKQVEKYLSRFGRNSREGQQERDFLKAAHYIQMAYDKYIEDQRKEKQSCLK